MKEKVEFELAFKLKYAAVNGVFLCPEKLRYCCLYSKWRHPDPNLEGICFAQQKTDASILSVLTPIWYDWNRVNVLVFLVSILDTCILSLFGLYFRYSHRVFS